MNAAPTTPTSSPRARLGPARRRAPALASLSGIVGLLGRKRMLVTMLALGWVGPMDGSPAAGTAAEGRAIAAAAPKYTEEEVKAAVLVGFARTTEWPAGTFADGPRTLVIGLLGRDTLGERARTNFQPTTGSSQNVRFVVVSPDQATQDCHVLFIPRTERRRAREVIDSLRKAPVLIVGEADDFLDQGGMVNLLPRDGKMKFEVDLNATKSASLRIPARVLASAVNVRGRYD